MRAIINTLILCVLLVAVSACNDSNLAKNEPSQQVAEQGTFSDNTGTGGGDTRAAGTGDGNTKASDTDTGAGDTKVTVTNDTTTGGTNKNDEKAGGAGADGLKAGGADVAQVQLGLRPSYLVDDMSKSDLKIKLKSCEKARSNGQILPFPIAARRCNFRNIRRKGSEIYEWVDVLAQQVGVKGIFSDWPATTNYYANCVGLK